jgi:hypothetical protein
MRHLRAGKELGAIMRRRRHEYLFTVDGRKAETVLQQLLARSGVGLGGDFDQV